MSAVELETEQQLSRKSESPLRVLFVVLGRDLYGAEQATLRLWQRLDLSRVRPQTLILEDTDDPSDMLRAARKFGDRLKVHAHRAVGPIAFRGFLRDLLARQPADVVCSVGYKCDVYCVVGLSGLTARHVSVLHGWVSTTLRLQFYNWLDRQCLKRLDGIFTVAGHLEEEAQRLNRARRVTCLRNGVDAQALRDRAGTRPGEWTDNPTIVYVGRLEAEKGLRHLLDAVATIPDLNLVLVGSGPLDEALRQHAKARGLGERIRFAGFQPDTAPWISAADMLVLPSFTEGLPLVLLEAMALGTPVIASSVGGIPDLLGNDERGLLVPPGDTLALSRAISRLKADTGLSTELAERARQLVELEYTEPLVARRFEDSLHEWFGHG